MDGQNVLYIQTPRLIIDEHYLVQGHTFKHDHAGNIIFFFPGYTNEFQLPNPGLRLYKCRELTFPLVPQEDARRSSVSGTLTRSRTTREAASGARHPPHIPASPQMQYAGWAPTEQAPGFSPEYGSGWDRPPQPYEAGGSGWHEANSEEWAQPRYGWQSMYSSDSDGFPPPVRPRQSVSARHDLDDINMRLGALDIRTGEIQNTLETHVQDTTQWRQQQHQQMMDMNALLKQQHDYMMGYWQSQGYNPGPQP